MSETIEHQPHTQAWDNYWQGSRKAGSTGTGGAQDPVLADFWTAFFTTELSALADARLLDIGCGSGAVTEFALKVSKQQLVHPKITCLDSSASAIEHVKQTFPGVATVQANAADTPLPDGFFDYIVSQFGLEYAGPGALTEVARLLRHGGTIALVMHMRDGAIDRECGRDQQAITDVLDSGLFPALIHLFEENMALRKGQGSRVGFELADKALNPCVKAVETVITGHGKDVVGGLIYRIYADTAHMYQKMNAFHPEEVIAWANKVEGELLAFTSRLQSMQAAALDEAELEQAIASLAEGGIEISSRDTLSMGEENEPAAWVLKGHRKVGSE